MPKTLNRFKENMKKSELRHIIREELLKETFVKILLSYDQATYLLDALTGDPKLKNDNIIQGIIKSLSKKTNPGR